MSHEAPSLVWSVTCLMVPRVVVAPSGFGAVHWLEVGLLTNRLTMNRLAAFLLSFLFGCGYAFQGSTSILPPSVKTLYIAPVGNSSTEPRLAGFLTESLRDRFGRSGAFRVVDSLSEGDAVLSVRLKGVLIGASTSTSTTNQALQMNNTMVLAAELRRANGQTLWSDPSMTVTRGSAATRGAVVTSSSEFASSGLAAVDLVGLNDREVARSQQQAALMSLVEQAARRVYEESVAPDF